MFYDFDGNRAGPDDADSCGGNGAAGVAAFDICDGGGTRGLREEHDSSQEFAMDFWRAFAF
jgi:hypothetical protein